ncbi:MAG: hypothetical protein FD169_6 [Bacillota bacterium]|nr:MAG: hypothetical protein FD169_6 [Bacillota bacterium]
MTTIGIGVDDAETSAYRSNDSNCHPQSLWQYMLRDLECVQTTPAEVADQDTLEL